MVGVGHTGIRRAFALPCRSDAARFACDYAAPPMGARVSSLCTTGLISPWCYIAPSKNRPHCAPRRPHTRNKARFDIRPPDIVGPLIGAHFEVLVNSSLIRC
jgi:hypothetical protein